jgi:hypothetical protein
MYVNIRPVGAELFHADRRTDGRTDITKIIVTFCSVLTALKNYTDIYVIIAENVQTLEVITVKLHRCQETLQEITQKLKNNSVVLFSKASRS